MSWIHYQALSPAGELVTFGEIWAPLSVENGYVCATIMPGQQHGPADVYCGHAVCRASLAEEAACRQRRATEDDRRDYDGWAE